MKLHTAGTLSPLNALLPPPPERIGRCRSCCRPVERVEAARFKRGSYDGLAPPPIEPPPPLEAGRPAVERGLMSSAGLMLSATATPPPTLPLMLPPPRARRGGG
jgi:hypothetical protein